MSPSQPVTATSRSCCAGLRRTCVALLALIGVLGSSSWFAREPLLRWSADLWIVSDPIDAADAVAVFGGGIENRPFAATAFYRAGLVKKVLVSNSQSGAAERLGLAPSQVAAIRDILIKLGVPASDIEEFGDSLKNTHQEVLALRAWAERSGAHSIIVPTEIFSTRRVRWMLHRAFGGAFEVRVPALEHPDYRRDDWWHHVDGLVTFQNEVLKYVYYRLKY